MPKTLTIFFNPKLNKICKVKSAKEKLPTPRIVATYKLDLADVKKQIENNLLRENTILTSKARRDLDKMLIKAKNDGLFDKSILSNFKNYSISFNQ